MKTQELGTIATTLKLIGCSKQDIKECHQKALEISEIHIARKYGVITDKQINSEVTEIVFDEIIHWSNS